MPRAFAIFDPRIRAKNDRMPDNTAMIQEPRRDQAGPLLDPEEIAQSGIVPQFGMISRALWASPVRNSLVLLAAVLILVIVGTAYGQIRLNRWNQPFYDALARHDFPQFMEQLGIFGLIAGALLALSVSQNWLNQMVKLKLRDGLIHDLVQNWLVPGRAFRLANAGAIGINPDQRMHEDARHLTELTADLGIGLLQASILLATFINVLWSLSSHFVFQIAGSHYAVPGYMVWAAILYSGSASLLSYWVGRGLIARNAERYAVEADLRFSLVRVNEHIDEIALSNGETDEIRRIDLDIDAVLGAMRRLVTGLTNLTWITSGYGWFTLVAPILVAAPLYFAGDLSFGGLMMASGAFIQVQSSLRWFGDNFSTIADWRATLLRVASFRRAVLNTESRDTGPHIEYAEGPAGIITVDNLKVDSSSEHMMLAETHVEVRAGERVLIVSESGPAKTLLFRAFSGLWPWGSGQITRAKNEEALYLPRTPYLPPGTLREVLAYPLGVDTFEAAAFQTSLERLNLMRLIPLLDVQRRWEHELDDDEQHVLAFVRALLHSPPWIFIDESLDGFDEATRARVIDVMTKDLTRTAIIYIGHTDAHNDVFRKRLHLVKNPEGGVPAETPRRAAQGVALGPTS
jgi:vitamin B12/bleomycin/antimicrobial peptide transport system ATP-binding/permease protein